MGQLMDKVGFGLTAASSVYQASSIIANIALAAENDEIDDFADVAALLFSAFSGDGPDPVQEQIVQQLDEVLEGLDDLTLQVSDLGDDLQQQINAQTSLQLERDMGALFNDVEQIRAELSSYDPLAQPNEPGYLSPQDLSDMPARVGNLVSDISSDALTILTPTDGYTPTIDMALGVANGLKAAAFLYLQAQTRFESEGFGLDSFKLPLQQAALVFQRVEQRILDQLDVSDVQMEFRVDPPFDNKETVTLDFNGDGVLDTVTYSHEFVESVVSVNIADDTGFEASTRTDDPIIALETYPIGRSPDENYLLIFGQGGNTYDVMISDHMITLDASGLPAFVTNPLGQDVRTLSIDDTEDELLAERTLETLAYFDILERLGITFDDAGRIDSSDYATFAAALEEYTSGGQYRATSADGQATVEGSAGRDDVRGDNQDNLLRGLGDNDTIFGRAGDDEIYGGAGDDLIRGDFLEPAQTYDPTLQDGDDLLDGGTGFDRLFGGGGNDTLRAEDGALMYGDLGNDLMEVGTPASRVTTGANQDSRLYGGDGNDTLRGGSGDDMMSGGADDDSLEGGAGNDKISPGAGNDIVSGGLGHDAVVFAGARADYTISDVVIDRPTFGVRGDILVPILTGFSAVIRGAEGVNTVSGVEELVFSDTRVTLDFLTAAGAATEGMDLIAGLGSDDLIDGLGGDDALHGGNAGQNTLIGGLGNDSLFGGPVDDSLMGGDGNDLLDGGFGFDTLDGGAGTDTATYAFYSGATLVDLAAGLATFEGTPRFEAIRNVENVIGSGGANDLRGDDGANILTGANANDILRGQGGDDRLRGHAGDDTLHGGDGADAVFGGPGNDTIRGGDGADTIYAGPGDDDIGGGAGNDVIDGNAGANIIWGGLGNDTVQGGSDSDTVYGGGDGTNRLFGNDGDDLIYGGAGGDFIGGGAGADTIRGSDGADTVYGGLGNDNIGGRSGNDLIFASAGANTIWGGAGDDTVHGGTGRDVMNGGPGADTFVFATAAQIGIGAGRDVISGFASGEDRIDLSALNTQFNGAAGLLGGGQASFYHFAADGLLIGDQNGTGGADWVLDLAGAPNVSADDFLL